MCVAMPGEIIEVNGDKAIVGFGNIKKEIIISLLNNVKVGEYVLVHAGFAINKIDQQEAKETLELFSELADVMEGTNSYGE